MGRNYYCLVSGLAELTLEADRKGFDAMALREEIVAELSPRDKGYVRMLYTFYDVENVINAIRCRTAFNALGNLSREEIAEEIMNPQRLPAEIMQAVRTCQNIRSEDEGEESVSGEPQPVEKLLWEAFYAECARSECGFIRDWFDFDRTLRNIAAAYTARSGGMGIAGKLVGGGEIVEALARSAAADFGLRSEVDYVEQVIALLDIKNIIEKENRLDRIRWDKSDELTTFDYFNIEVLLAYLIKVNIIHRWVALSPVHGKEMFHLLISELVDKENIRNAEDEELEKAGR